MLKRFLLLLGCTLLALACWALLVSTSPHFAFTIGGH
jgi:hypothetical protein